MTQHTTPYDIEQIGYTVVRFNSSGIFETHKDHMVDPYAETRPPKGPQVEGIQFAPQEANKILPAMVLLHDRYGLTSHIQELAKGLSSQGYVVLVPNLYVRQGGMVTANAEVADALMERVNEQQALQDINASFEFLNANLTEDINLERTTRNAHAVIGFGMGGSLAIKTAAHRRRLQAAVAICGTLPTDPELAQRLYCPLLLQTPGKSVLNSAEERDQFCQTAKQAGKTVEVKTYPEASDEFWQSSTPGYRASDLEKTLQTSIDFINRIIHKTP
ncbi:MAG: dienelactone hydrolase family protein [Nitrospirales bacterium]